MAQQAPPRVSFSDKDLENGAPANERAASRKWSTAPGNIEDLDEYTALQKYISTYRDPKAAAADDAEGQNKDAADAGKGKQWWQFWRSGTSPNAKATDTGVVPEDWLEADIKQGISNHDVENRRKRFGWNEITTEKENLFIKFLSFFTGPILYSKSARKPSFFCLCPAHRYAMLHFPRRLPMAFSLSHPPALLIPRMASKLCIAARQAAPPHTQSGAALITHAKQANNGPIG